MKHTLISISLLLLFSCKKKEEVTPKESGVTSTQKISVLCRDTTIIRTHPHFVKSYYKLYETCNKVTITFGITKQEVTVDKPTGANIVSNYTDFTKYAEDKNVNKILYILYIDPKLNRMVYELDESGSGTVSGYGYSSK